MSKTKPLAGKTITLPVFVRAKKDEYGFDDSVDGYNLRVASWGGQDKGDFVVCATSVTFTVPADFDPVPEMVAALQAQKAKLTAEFSAAVAALNKQLSELQAIECEVSA